MSTGGSEAATAEVPPIHTLHDCYNYLELLPLVLDPLLHHLRLS